MKVLVKRGDWMLLGAAKPAARFGMYVPAVRNNRMRAVKR